MKKTIVLLSLLLAAFAAIISPTPAAASPCEKDNNRVLSFPFWYRGIVDDKCNIKTDDPSWIGKLILNIGEILLQLVGYVTIGLIIYGGFQYMTSAGSASRVESAKKTITNALIGLVIAILATVIVNVVFGLVK